MVFQVIQNSPWHYILAFGAMLLTLVLMVLTISSKVSAKLKPWIVGAGIAVVIMCIVALVVGGQQRVDRNDANFSKQLMDEYGVTSSRSFYEIDLDFTRFDEARTVFTKDGKDTPIFIKLVNSDGKQETMAFTVIDDKALYPKPSK